MLLACNLFTLGNDYPNAEIGTLTSQALREGSLSATAASLVLTQRAIQTLIITPEVSVTHIPPTLSSLQSPQPGLLIEGHVYLEDGLGLASVNIYRSFASYTGEVIATTNDEGYYQSAFQGIPGDEMVTVWAELEGFSIYPADDSWSWEPGIFYWRHYYGHEVKTLDFIAEEEDED